MFEHESFYYSARTEANVRDSDGTIRFARNFSSAGEKCTLRAINKYKKPYLNVDVDNPLIQEEVLHWIRENDIKVLNVAGNSEETAAGIQKIVYDYLMETFSLLKTGN